MLDDGITMSEFAHRAFRGTEGFARQLKRNREPAAGLPLAREAARRMGLKTKAKVNSRLSLPRFPRFRPQGSLHRLRPFRSATLPCLSANPCRAPRAERATRAGPQLYQEIAVEAPAGYKPTRPKICWNRGSERRGSNTGSTPMIRSPVSCALTARSKAAKA